MGAWLEAFEKLQPDQQERVRRWIDLNRLIAHALRIDWDDWVSDYLRPSMENPLDYTFMYACFPDFAGLDAEGQGVSFSRALDPATALVARVPLRAQNNMGRLAPATQDGLGALLETGEPPSVAVLPSDVVQLQKIFRRERALARLKRKDFRSVLVERIGDEVALKLKDGDTLMRTNVLEFSATLRKALV